MQFAQFPSRIIIEYVTVASSESIDKIKCLIFCIHRRDKIIKKKNDRAYYIVYQTFHLSRFQPLCYKHCNIIAIKNSMLMRTFYAIHLGHCSTLLVTANWQHIMHASSSCLHHNENEMYRMPEIDF